MLPLAAIVFILTPTSLPAPAPHVQRYALVIGANQGNVSDAPLRYATTDAAQMAQVLQKFGGFEPGDVAVLRNPTADQVRAAFNSVRLSGGERANSLFLVYYSGHADALNMHLNGSTLAWDEFVRLTNGTAATTRLMLVDACRSGELTQVKGAARDTPFALPQGGPALPRGIAIVTSASAGENAQESNLLHGSFFTHHFIAALRGAGDQNGDGHVTLNEAYDYSALQTVSDTANTLVGVQHATYRYHLSGRLDLPLTSPGYMGDLVSVHIGASGTYFFHRERRDGPLALEMAIPAGMNRAVWLPAGTYYVQRRTPGAVYTGTLELQENHPTALDDTQLQRNEYTRLASKGGMVPHVEAEVDEPPEAEPSTPPKLQLGAMFSVGAPLLKSFGPATGASLGIGVPFGIWAIDTQIRYLHTGAQNDALRISESEVSGAVGVRWLLVDTEHFDLWAGPRAGLLWVGQQYSGAGATNLASQGRWAFLGEAMVRADVPLPAGFYLSAEASLRVVPLRAEGADKTATSLVSWQPVASLGLGKTW